MFCIKAGQLQQEGSTCLQRSRAELWRKWKQQRCWDCGHRLFKIAFYWNQLNLWKHGNQCALFTISYIHISPLTFSLSSNTLQWKYQLRPDSFSLCHWSGRPKKPHSLVSLPHPNSFGLTRMWWSFQLVDFRCWGIWAKTATACQEPYPIP